MTIDWTTLGVGVLTAVSAIIGGALVATMQGKSAERHAADERRDRDRVERRAAYVALLTQLDNAVASIAGVAQYGHMANLTAPDAAKPFVEAAATAELYAPADVWRDMQPFVRGVTMWANYITVMSSDPHSSDLPRILEQMKVLRAESAEAIDALRDRYMAAAKRDILEHR